MNSVDSREVLVPFTPRERESFFEAVARHRRAAWRVTIVTGLCAALLAFVVGVLMAPLLYGFIILALDVVNFFHRTPEVVKPAMDVVGQLIDHPEKVPALRWLYVGWITALPGLALMAVASLGLARLVRRSAVFDASALLLRAPDTSRLREIQLSNVVAEMALAAGIPTPRVLVTSVPTVNAAVFGPNEAQATVVASERLIESLDREQMQGVVAHLVGSIANGDARIGLRVAVVLSLFGLMARLSNSMVDRTAGRLLIGVVGAVLRPTVKGADLLVDELVNPFEKPQPAEANTRESAQAKPSATTKDSSEVGWRDFALFPVTGPLMLTGFLAGFASTVLLAPLLALAWRSRKYMADAIAVRLTREPNALAGALQAMARTRAERAFAPWAAHLCVAESRAGGTGMLGGSWIGMFPSLDRRLKALDTLGATVAVAKRALPVTAVLVLAPLVAIVVGLLSFATYLLVLVSMAIGGLFTWVPVAILHGLLRSLAG
jgi:Zn-dependent protease with chaperone function